MSQIWSRAHHQNSLRLIASDFLKSESKQKLIQSGVSAVIQPAGSIKDKEIIRYANATDTVLVFSKTRHFRH